MKNQRMNTLIVIGLLLLAVSCQVETSAPRATATPISELGEESVGGPQVEPTTVPTAAVVEELTPTPEETSTPQEPAAEDTPEFKYEAIDGILPAYLMSSDYQALEALMGDSFIIGHWGSEGQTMSPAEAIAQLRSNLLPDPTTFRFTKDHSYFPDLGEFDPTKAFGYEVKVVDLVYSEGWGADGQGEAILTIGLNPDGQYWPGMIYAPAGFDEGKEESPGGYLTYINEHAGYAFDYPAGWIVQGEPDSHSYGYVIILKSFKLGRGPGPVSVDQVKLDFVTCNSARCNTLQATQARIDEQVAAGMLEILSEENWTLAGGIPAVRRQVVGEMGIEAASLITEIDGQSLQVSGFGDLSAFDEVVRTLRPTRSEPADGGLRAVLEIPQSLPVGEAVKLHFLLINDSGSNLYLLNWYTPLEGIGGEIFQVKRDGRTLPYLGLLASRGDPTPGAYTLLHPGEIIPVEVDLSSAYDFSIPGNYTIEFISPRISHVARTGAEMVNSVDDLGPVQIPANEVTVKIDAGDFSSADRGATQDTLIHYLTWLSEGKYADAVELHGAGYEVLKDMNPTADPDDLAGLLEAGCTTNGFHCLPIKTITSMGTSEPNTYEFALQFENPDGNLFVLDPEGDWPENELPRSLFRYTVVPVVDKFVVHEFPPYTP